MYSYPPFGICILIFTPGFGGNWYRSWDAHYENIKHIIYLVIYSFIYWQDISTDSKKILKINASVGHSTYILFKFVCIIIGEQIKYQCLKDGLHLLILDRLGKLFLQKKENNEEVSKTEINHLENA